MQCDHCSKIVERVFSTRSRCKYRACSQPCNAALARAVPWTEERREKHVVMIKAANARYWSTDEIRQRASEMQASALPETKARRSAAGKVGCISAMHKKRKSRSMRESTGECELASLLEIRFGSHNIDRHVIHHGYNVDIHVKSIDVWVSFDGVYYHGLDRPYDRLPPAIRRKYDRDRAADAAFAERGERLVRITCREWSRMTRMVRELWVMCNIG